VSKYAIFKDGKQIGKAHEFMCVAVIAAQKQGIAIEAGGKKRGGYSIEIIEEVKL
jgi:hypothetical protein